MKLTKYTKQNLIFILCGVITLVTLILTICMYVFYKKDMKNVIETNNNEENDLTEEYKTKYEELKQEHEKVVKESNDEKIKSENLQKEVEELKKQQENIKNIKEEYQKKLEEHKILSQQQLEEQNVLFQRQLAEEEAKAEEKINEEIEKYKNKAAEKNNENMQEALRKKDEEYAEYLEEQEEEKNDEIKQLREQLRRLKLSPDGLPGTLPNLQSTVTSKTLDDKSKDTTPSSEQLLTENNFLKQHLNNALHDKEELEIELKTLLSKYE